MSEERHSPPSISLGGSPLASRVVETIHLAFGPRKAVVVVFDPYDPDGAPALYSNAGAADLVPVLRAVLARIEAGTLRMPVDPDTVRWADVERGDGTTG